MRIKKEATAVQKSVPADDVIVLDIKLTQKQLDKAGVVAVFDSDQVIGWGTIDYVEKEVHDWLENNECDEATIYLPIKVIKKKASFTTEPVVY